MPFLELFLERHRGPNSADVWTISDRGLRVLTALSWAIWLTCASVGLWQAMHRVVDGTDGTAFDDYLTFIARFWSHAALYHPDDLQGFHYLPIMLILGTPLSWVSLELGALIFGLAAVGFFTFAVYRLARATVPSHAAAAAGTILLACGSAGIVTVRLLQMQMPMTAAMICAASSAMGARWRSTAIWLIVAVALKPLAIVFALLVAATVPQTRFPLVAGIAALLLLPFAFGSISYVSAEYVSYVQQLSHISDAPPSQWSPQAEISTLLRFVGLDLNSTVRLAIRFAAALVTLMLGWRIAALGASRATGLALFVLACCYIGLFNPRQEDVSFIIVSPAAAVIGVVFFQYNAADWRGWVCTYLGLLIGPQWGHEAGPWLYPAMMILIWSGVLLLMCNPLRWKAFVMHGEGNQTADRAQMAAMTAKA